MRNITRPLSPRQRQILSLIAYGLTQREIARILEISYQTVKNHAQAIRDLYGVHTTAHAVTEGIRRGDVDLDLAHDTVRGRLVE